MAKEESNMKIVVIGGTGLIGSKVVSKLGERGYDVIAASPNSGVNTLTGEGLTKVLEGASVVVDVSNSPSFEDDAVMEKNGVMLLIDPMSYQYLVGAEIDYQEGLEGAQFVIKNPNAQSTCGCGSSFSV